MLLGRLHQAQVFLSHQRTHALGNRQARLEIYGENLSNHRAQFKATETVVIAVMEPLVPVTVTI